MKTSIDNADRRGSEMLHSEGAGPAAYPVARALQGLRYDTWVEPFLGRGDVTRAASPHGRVILNDLDCARTKLAKAKACSVSEGKCHLLEGATVSCGRDWKEFLRFDSPSTLFFLDPPWNGPRAEVTRAYSRNRPVGPDELVARTKGLRGTVAIYYADRPDTRRALCHAPFRCRTIQRQVFNQKFTQIVAVKPARGT